MVKKQEILKEQVLPSILINYLFLFALEDIYIL